MAGAANIVNVAAEPRGKKSLDSEMAERVARSVERMVDDRFLGNRSAAAEALGISQPHLSNIINRKTSVGIVFLLKLRQVSGRSLDDLLELGIMLVEPGFEFGQLGNNALIE